MSDINPGDIVVLRTDPPFQNESNAAADPDTVKLVVKRRGSPAKTYEYNVDAEIVKDDTGEYHAEIVVEKPGKHYFRWIGEGGIQAVEEGEFTAVQKFS